MGNLHEDVACFQGIRMLTETIKRNRHFEQLSARRGANRYHENNRPLRCNSNSWEKAYAFASGEINIL